MKHCKIMVISLVLLLLVQMIAGVFVSKQIQADAQFCISQDLPRHTLLKVNITTVGNIQFQFKEGMLPVFGVSLESIKYSRSLTTQKYGTHYFCFINKDQTKAKVTFQIAIGKHANDYGSAVDGDDLIGALSNQARIAEQFIQDIVKENSEGLQIMVAEAKQRFNFTNLYMFSGMFAVLSIVLTYLQYNVIRKYLHSRKYI